MPNTIAENLQRLVAAKSAIANAITAKGGTVTAGDGLEDFAADIATIPSGHSPENLYLKFIGTEPFTLKQYSVTNKTWNGTIEYSTDGTNWVEWTQGNVEISSSLSSPYVLFMRGINNTVITGQQTNDYRKFVFTTNGTIDCVGNIDTLLDYRYTAFGYDAPKTTSGCFEYLFKDCTMLTSAPSLPAKSLVGSTQYTYAGLFYNCTALTSAPALPATQLVYGCYKEMFGNCTSLISLPELPAITLNGDCYYKMFNGCTNIKLSSTQTEEFNTPYRIPTEGTGTTASGALNYMFNSTGGTFTGTPTINTTYYTSNAVV